jgi:hypothetical protein
MAIVRYEITEGAAPFTVSISPSYIPNQVKPALGAYYFNDVPNGTYTITVTDSVGCFISFPVYVDCSAEACLDCSPTYLFRYAQSAIAVGDQIFVGERDINPLIVRFTDPDDLSSYDSITTVGMGDLTRGLDSVCYSSVTGKLYFSGRYNSTGSLAIVEVDPTTLAYTIHPILGISGYLFSIDTDGTYIYGGGPSSFFRIRISDWLLDFETLYPIGYNDTTAVKVNSSRGVFYATSQGGGGGAFDQLAIVSMTDLSSYTIVSLTGYVSAPSDDIAVYDDGVTCKVYVAGRNNIPNYGGACIETTAGNTVTGIDITPSNGFFIDNTIIYSAGRTGLIETFDESDPSTITQYDLGASFEIGEIVFISTRLFLTREGDDGIAKLCEYTCIGVEPDCDLDGEVSDATPAPTTTTTSTTSGGTTTTTSTTIFEICLGCGLYFDE